MPAISIIVPIYNVSQYLRRCLDSCVNQTMDGIEIIAVNDCSPDPLDSEIMREYGAKYPDKVRCIWHSENKKQGGARNAGIRAAKGEYLCFVDSDDYIDLRMCEKLYGKAKENNADYVYCDYYKVKNSLCYFDRFTELDKHFEVNRHFVGVSWGSLVKRALFIENNLRFAEGLLYGTEDVPMTMLLLALSKNRLKAPEALYCYCVNPASSIQSSTIRDRAPYIYEAFAQTRRRCERTFSQNDLFLFDAQSVLWLFDVLFIVYGYLHANNIDMLKKYLHANNIDMLKVIASIRHDYRREKISFFWDLTHQSFTDEQVKMQLFRFDCAHLRHALQDYRHVVVWGAGERGIRFCGYLREAGIPFAVTDANPNLRSANGLDVQPWEALRGCADVVVVTPKTRFDGIRALVGDGMPVLGMEELLN